MSQKDLRIAAWNANGVLNKKHDLEVFLNTQHIDICLVSETHMTNQSYLKIRGYKTYHTIHPDNQAKGGSAVIIKENINHYEERHLQRNDIQLTAVGVIATKQKLKVGAVYCPPRHNLKKEDYLTLLTHLGERFIIGGDYNSKHVDWGSRLTTTKGRELRKAIQETNCNHHSTGKPTYWPTDTNKIPDLLDFFITRKVSPNFTDVEENFDMDSDHSAAILTLSETVIKRVARATLTNRTTDWQSFQIDLQNKINLNISLRTAQELEEATESFTRLIQTVAHNNTKEITHITKGVNYPFEIRELVREKRRARRRWQQSRDPADKAVLNRTTQKLRREIQKLKEETVNSYLQGLSAYSDTDHSLWKATKKIKRTITSVPPIKSNHGSWAREDKQKADLFAQHLAEVFTPNQAQTHHLTNYIDNPNSEKIRPTSPKEVAEQIRSHLNPNKAPGFDLITGQILKHLPRKGITMLTYLFNAAFRLRFVPSCWKVAEVIMLLKPGKQPNDVKSYRPISLLPIVSKLFEKLLLKRLRPIIDNNNLIPDFQFGFRQKHSTIDQVHRITDIIEYALEGKQVCSAVFLDVAQAFDKVWHKGLILKLNKILPKQYVEVVTSYISGRCFRIKQENQYSDLMEIKAGVPQGSVLGPVLYLLYTSDIPKTKSATVAMFADDTALLAVGKEQRLSTKLLQTASNEIVKWTKQWRIKLNETKSVHVNFTNKLLKDPPTLDINGTVIPYENNAKYLGMTLDAKLRWKAHIRKKMEELGIKYRLHYWLIGRNSKLSTANKLLIYNQILKPVWLYGIQLWGCASDSNIKRIQTFQNKVLRNIVNAPWYVRNLDLHRDLRTPTVSEEIKRFAKKHKARLQHHINREALQLLTNQHHVRRLKRKKPADLM